MGWADFLLARAEDDEAEFDAACEYEAEQLRQDGMPGTTAAEIREFWLRPETLTRWPRWMADVKAKRSVVQLYEAHLGRVLAYRSAQARYGEDEAAAVNRRLQEARCRAAEDAVRALAAVYADHEDFPGEDL